MNIKMVLCPFCLKEVQEELCPYCGKEVTYNGDPMHLHPGYVLKGKHPYVFGAALGQGGFGITYIALDMQTNQRVAIKEYFPTYCAGRTDDLSVASYRGQEEEFRKGRDRFLDEARMVKSLSDLPSVVNILDFFEANNSAYLVMEFLEGRSLKDCVKQDGKFEVQKFLKQIRPLMADVEKMHQRGVIHRDIAPDNIIMLADGQLKLIDFGAARYFAGDKSMTIVVKKGFAPVEQYMRKGSNAATDVYALAATIYYCLTGMVLPDSVERQYGEAVYQAPTALGVALSGLQERALDKALQVDQKDRTQSVADLMKDLEKSSEAKQKKSIQKTKKKPVRINWWIPGVAVILLFCSGVLIMGRENREESVHTESVQTEIPEITLPEATPQETKPTVHLSAEALQYNEAVDCFNNGEYGKAAIALAKLGDYRDAKQRSRQIWDAIATRNTVSVGHHYTVAVRENGKVYACGRDAPDVRNWTDIISITNTSPMLGIRSDGTVMITDTRKGSRRVKKDGWTDIVAVDTDGHSIFGLRADGTVVASLETEYPTWWMAKKEVVPYQKQFTDLQNVVEIRVGYRSGPMVKLADNTVFVNFAVAEGYNIVDICGTFHGSVLLKQDGTVLYDRVYKTKNTKTGDKIERDLSKWTDIVAISGSDWEQVLGLKSDGTVVATGSNDQKQLNVSKWTDIVAIWSGNSYSVGLKSDGSFVSCGTGSASRRSETEKWTDIKLPADRDALLAAIDLDYITEE